jgi:hypothetical protein
MSGHESRTNRAKHPTFAVIALQTFSKMSSTLAPPTVSARSTHLTNDQRA